MAISKGFAALIAIMAMVIYLQMRGLSEQELKLRVSGKRVLVTGASLGIGRELVKEYAHLGAAEIVIVARSKDKLISLRDEVLGSLRLDMKQNPVEQEHWPPRIHIISADLSSEETCLGVIDQAVEAM